MVTFVRLMLVVLAALFLARAPVALGFQPAHDHSGHLASAMLQAHGPFGDHRIDRQCSEAGCAAAACLMQWTATLPDCLVLIRHASSMSYPIDNSARIDRMRDAPPSPPPRPSLDDHSGRDAA